MALKAVVSKLDDVDEALRGLYVPNADGTFRLDAEGIEDVTGLKNALSSERKSRKAADDARNAQAQEFEGLDPVEARNVLSKFASDEERKMLKDGNLDAVVEKRLEKLRGDFEKKLKASNEATDAALATKQRWLDRVRDSHLREAAAKAGLHDSAIDDAIFRGRSMFTLDDSGAAVQLEDGLPKLGRDGKTNFSPPEWLEGMRETAPHWFPSTGSGGGSPQTNGRGPGTQAKSLKRADYDAMPPQEQAKAATSGVPIVD